MKRIALLAATVVAAGCVSNPPPPPPPPPVYGVDVIVYWTFQHYDYTGTFQPLDCAQAGVDDVYLEFSDGYTTTVPCSQGGVDGVTVRDFIPGNYWVAVTGYRNGVLAPLYYSGGVNFTKYDGTDAVVYADVPGIPGNLTLSSTLVGWNGSAYVPYPSPACVNGNTDFLTYEVRDGVGIVLAQGQVACSTNPPDVVFSGASAIDKDDLAIRVKAWQNTAPPTQVMDSCTVGFAHFGANDVASINVYYPIPSPCL